MITTARDTREPAVLMASDENAENSVLGAMLIDSRAADIAFEELEAEDFYTPRNRTLFETFERVARAGGLDEVSVETALDSAGKLEYIGGSAQLGRLIMNTPSAANVETYCKLVLEKTELRAIQRLHTELGKRLNENAESGALLEYTSGAIDKLYDRRMKVSGDPVDLHDIAEKVAFEALTLPPREFWGFQCGVGGGAIDELLGGFTQGHYVVFSARTGMGKSTLTNAIARGVRQSNPDAGEPLIINTEMSLDGIARAALASASGVHTQGLLKRNLGEGQRIMVDRVIQERRLAGVKVKDMSAPTLPQIKATAQRHQRKFGLPLLIIDLAGHIRAPGKTDYERLSNVSKGIAALKSELKTCIIACVQISRAAFLNDDKRPELKDLKGTGSWEEDADKVILLHRPSAYDGNADNRTEVIQAKDRDHGEVRSTWIEYLKGKCQFVRAGGK